MHSPLTKAKKRIVSAVCVLGMVALCLGVVGYQNKLKAEDNLPVVTRGVVDQINQIPESKRNIYDKNADAAQLGTKENPLFILEIVPYVEWGTFGYHISGCEPIDMDQLRGSGYMGKIGSMGIGKVTMEKAFFFGEEPEYKNTKWDSQPVKCTYDAKEFKGYYELVENGQGFFRQQEDGTIVKADGGNIIWHTINSTEMSKKYSSQTFTEKDAQKEILKKTGERIYTKREWTDSDPVYITYNYYTYESNDDFLKDTLQLSEQAADNYSVIIKTITPKELNENLKWAEYADLYIVTPTIEDSSFAEMWEKFKRYDHPLTANKSNGFENTSSDENRDISWDVAKTMYDKITADKNYAGIMMTALVYRSMQNSKSITLDVLDWNLKKIGTKTNVTAYNNNMYKLVVMLTSMKQDLFKRLYLDEENPMIVGVEDKNTNKKKGIFKLQTGDAQEYWSMYTFLPVGKTGEELSWNWEEYWNKHWQDYEMAGNITTTGKYVNNHVFIGAEGGDILRDYMKSDIYIKNDDVKTTDFAGHIGDIENSVGTPSEAVRYILGVKNNGDDKIKGDLNILDIEPCYDSENGYSLTKNYIYNMMPNFVGNVNITHMTTAEFIGTTQDLNSTYNMIFMGLDDGAYRKDEKGETIWNDKYMKGKIYFHTGDMAKASNEDMAKRVDFLKNYNTTEMRFAGNDITKIKKKELENFLDAGYPIVAVPYLYNTDNTKIDQNSNICKFIQTNRRKEGIPLYITLGEDGNGNSSATLIENALRETQATIEWDELPNIYNGETVDEKSNTIADANYLKTNADGRSLLPFKFTVKDASKHTYNYRIYIDQNRDSKFDEDEIFYEGDDFAALDEKQGTTTGKTLKVSELFVGLIQWKIEVYRTDNENIHFTKSGCSAAMNQTGIKQVIRVLQIDLSIDQRVDYPGKLNLESSETFNKYCQNLNDYQITFKTWSADKYMKYFEDNVFRFDYSKDIGTENPSSKSQKAITDIYNNYDMIIIGFGDGAGEKDINNEYGAVDFLKYFAAKGKSILFTHDFTSMNNIVTNSKDVTTKFGYTANKLLRDLMGMNRYKSVHRELGYNSNTELNEYEMLTNYQKKNQYDTVNDVNGNKLGQTQGFTYYAIDHFANGSSEQKMPYQSLKPNNDFNDNGNLTVTVTKTNEGQITQYPYKIGLWTTDSTTGEKVFDTSKLSVARTHAQWFQLDMEDPEVTVWYCLADDGGKALEGLMEKEKPWAGSSSLYGVSPNDVANNYYIYSKNNIYYSGVGHSTVTGDMEMKLLVNTIVGAYRQVYEAPIVEVLNPEAEISSRSPLSYTMNYNQEYDNDIVESISDKAVDVSKSEGAGSDSDSDMVKVRFSPVELNTIITRLSFSIYYTSGDSADKTYITTIYHEKSDGTVEELKTDEAKNWMYADTLDKNGKYTKHIRSMDEYYFYYPKAYLDTWTDTSGNTHEKRNNITFEIKNNKVKEAGYTYLNMQTQALFLLD